MGGGDLNSKKSWHPNTMKNQERVWKAEQAIAEEKKRMVELQRERAEERDRSELNNLISQNDGSNNDKRLSWMYDKPDKKVDQEAYLLGKSINKNPEQADKSEQDVINAVSRRVVGSSMLTAGGDTQVDMSRKIREDPLLLIKERERAARAALLNNPLQRRKLTELLRKDQDTRKESKSKKKSKDKKESHLDELLAAKLNALGGQKSVNLATLLDSDDSSSDSSSHGKKQKKKKKKHKKEKKKRREPKSSSDSEEERPKHKEKEYYQKDSKSMTKSKSDHDSEYSSARKRTSTDYDNSHNEAKKQKLTPERYYNNRDYDTDSKSSRPYSKNSSGEHNQRYYSKDQEKRNKNVDRKEIGRRTGLSEEEKAARLAEMAAAGASREIERGRRVAEQRAAAREPAAAVSRGHGARLLPDSLESRIHSNRHYIQRDKRHMNEHFARR